MIKSCCVGVWVICVCVCVLDSLKYVYIYIYTQISRSSKLARTPNEYDILAARGAALPEDTILPPIMHQYIFFVYLFDVNVLSAAHCTVRFDNSKALLVFHPLRQPLTVRLKEPQMEQSWEARNMYRWKPHSDLWHQCSVAGCTFQETSYAIIFL